MTKMTMLKFALFVLLYCLFAYVVTAKPYTAFDVKVSGKGQPIIFIPGATCSGDKWNETLARYRGKYQCHVLTLAGYAGVAPLSKAPYLSEIKHQIEDYITSNRLENVIIVGHSIGGVIGMWMAAENIVKLGKVVIVDAMPFFAQAQNPAAADTFSEAMAKGMLERYNAMDDKTLLAQQKMTAKFMCLDSTKWELIANWGLMSDKKTMAYTMTEMLGMDLRKKIASIACPVLVLAAYNPVPEYPGFTKEMVSQTFREQYKNCSKCILHVADGGCKHFIMYDASKWFYSELDNFFN